MTDVRMSAKKRREENPYHVRPETETGQVSTKRKKKTAAKEKRGSLKIRFS